MQSGKMLETNKIMDHLIALCVLVCLEWRLKVPPGGEAPPRHPDTERQPKNKFPGHGGVRT